MQLISDEVIVWIWQICDIIVTTEFLMSKFNPVILIFVPPYNDPEFGVTELADMAIFII